MMAWEYYGIPGKGCATQGDLEAKFSACSIHTVQAPQAASQHKVRVIDTITCHTGSQK